MLVDAKSYVDQVKRLVSHHKRLKRNGKLLFAGWYNKQNERGDVNLFEVYEHFPDPGLGKLETYLFPSTAEFPMKGALRLTVTSPSELKDAMARADNTLNSFLSYADREVIYPAGANWDEKIRELADASA